MNEKQKEIMDIVKAGVKNDDITLLEEAFYKSIAEKENKILKNILEKTPLNEDYLVFNEYIYQNAIFEAASSSNAEALSIIPNVLTEIHDCENSFNEVIKRDDLETFNSLYNLENAVFHLDLHALAIEYNSQKIINELLECEDYEPYVLGEALESNNIETVSKYFLANHEWFLDRIEESDEATQKFIDIHDRLVNSNDFKELVKEKGLELKDIENYTMDFFEENAPEKYKQLIHKKEIGKNVMNF